MTSEPDAAALLARALGTAPPEPDRPEVGTDAPAPADPDDPVPDDPASRP